MRKFAVIGNPVEHSLSPEIFNHYFLENNIDAIYVKHDISDISDIRKVMEENDYSGCNITSPFKETVAQYLDVVLENETGSINCIFKYDEKLYGINTDTHGIISIIDNNVEDRYNKNILVVGLGGAGKTVAHTLKYNKRLTIVNRDYSKSLLLQSQLLQSLSEPIYHDIKVEKFEDLEYAIKNNDVIINTLPRNVKNIFDKEWFDSSKIFIDANYDNDGLKEIVEYNGCKYIDGKRWLITQAYHSFILMLGFKPDEKTFGKNISKDNDRWL